MSINVLSEAKRCLHCKKPQCRVGCPIDTSIPEVIELLLNQDLNGAGQMLFDNNPLSLVCSIICNHEAQCEGHCILGRKGSPVTFGGIENYIADSYFDKMEIVCEPPNGKKVGIIGSGPAGITIAILMAKKGYDVTIFEGRQRIGGVLRYGIPEFRLPKTILARYKEKMLSMGIRIRPNVTIGGSLTIDDLLRDGYKAIFIGTGVWRPKKLGVKGESFGNVHFAIDYLVQPEVFDLGEEVAIIGAGNSAMDVARTALRRGTRKVTLFARSNHLGASERELEYTLLEGAEIKYNHKILEITEEGPLFEVTDENGEVSTQLYPADSTIVSVSQGPRNRLTSTTENLKANEQGLLMVDDHGRTSIEGIFASGDVVAGAKTVVGAVAYSKRTAEYMHEYIQSLPEDDK